jgi:acetylornithine/LysW-gamma-L-lysine aminotransferase
MVGVELRGRASPLLAALAREGVLALTAGPTVMRFLPPLVITEEEIDTVVERVEAVLKKHHRDTKDTEKSLL